MLPQVIRVASVAIQVLGRFEFPSSGVIPSGAVLQAERGISLVQSRCAGDSFDFAQDRLLGPLVKARAFGMTPPPFLDFISFGLDNKKFSFHH